MPITIIFLSNFLYGSVSQIKNLVIFKKIFLNKFFKIHGEVVHTLPEFIEICLGLSTV